MGDTPEVRSDLRQLEERSLLQCTRAPNQPAQYDLHPIVRRYAYDRLRNVAQTHAQLVGYFEAVPPAAKVQTLADLHPAIELYHHLTRAGRYDEAYHLFYDHLAMPLFFQLGAYQTRIELLRALFPDGKSQHPCLQREEYQAWILSSLGNSYSAAGQPTAAVPLNEQANAIHEKQGDKENLALGLINLADDQSRIGAFRAAATNLRRSIALCQEIEEEHLNENEAAGHQEYGRLLALCGDWAASAAELETALIHWTAEKDTQGQGLIWATRAHAALLRREAGAAQEAAREALRLADEFARTRFPLERDYVQAHWLLGWAALAKGELATAHPHLDEALRRCRAINNVEHEPVILLAMARLARAEARLGDAEELAEEARLIAERAGYKPDLADIHNLLAQLALDTGDRPAARTHAQRAHDYATCDGPPYAYQSALDEAQRLLAL
jgi:tetratricopeptide (TPR) repeat protein